MSDVIIAVLFVAVCILLYPKIFSKDKFEDIRDEEGRISIAVMPFQNMSNDTLWDVWQVGIQNELITNLSNSTELSVRQYQTMQEILQKSQQIDYASITPSIAGDISRKLEANTFIQGSIKSAGTEIRLNVHLIDSETEEIYKTFQIDGRTEDDVFGVTDSLSELIRNYLEIKALEQDVDYDFRKGFATSSAEAYRYYIQGLNSYFTGDYKSAIEILNTAIRIDTNFFAAYDWLLGVYSYYGWFEQDYSQIERAKQLVNKLMSWDKEKLSRIEQLSLKMIISAYIDKNPQEYIKNCRLLLEYDPQQRIYWHKLGDAYSSIRQYEQAIKAYGKALEIVKQWGVEDKWYMTYTSLGEAHIAKGDHSKGKEVEELGLSRFPDNLDLLWGLTISALSLGDTSEAEHYFAKYESIRKTEYFWSEAEIDHRLAHIYAQADLFEKSEEIWREIRQLEPQEPYHMRCFAIFLIEHEINIEEGLDLINRILELYPDYYDVLSYKGLGLYKLGHYERALETLDEAWDKRFSYSHWHYLLLQKVQQALASQNN